MTTTTTVIGNLTRDPELKYTSNGKAVLKLSVAVNRRQQVNGQWQDGATSFFDITCWGTLAENVAASATKGTRLVVTGRLEQSTWDGPDGSRKSKVELVADDIGISLTRNTVEVHQVNRDLTATPTVVEDEDPF